ncbi:hypothetical protein [Arthrobacter sp. NPDC058192]
MAQHSQNRTTSGSVSSGFASWSKGRKIYLAVGILACLAGVLMIAFSR